MKPKPLIKICGIKNTLLLKEFQVLGIHFIGLIFHPSSKRYVDLETAKKISAAAKEHNILPVGVFVDQTAKEMEEICLETNLQIVQLHGEHCRKQHHILPEYYQRIYVQAVGQDGKVIPDQAEGLIHCKPERDFLMFDSLQWGSGKKFNWENFSYSGEFRWFLAGGLTPDNVGDAVVRLQPDGIDISSGVENNFGQKDIELIQHLVNAVRHHHIERT